jgi:hypothetical protein
VICEPNVAAAVENAVLSPTSGSRLISDGVVIDVDVVVVVAVVVDDGVFESMFMALVAVSTTGLICGPALGCCGGGTVTSNGCMTIVVVGVGAATPSNAVASSLATRCSRSRCAMSTRCVPRANRQTKQPKTHSNTTPTSYGVGAAVSTATTAATGASALCVRLHQESQRLRSLLHAIRQANRLFGCRSNVSQNNDLRRHRRTRSDRLDPI